MDVLDCIEQFYQDRPGLFIALIALITIAVSIFLAYRIQLLKLIKKISTWITVCLVKTTNYYLIKLNKNRWVIKSDYEIKSLILTHKKPNILKPPLQFSVYDYNFTIKPSKKTKEWIFGIRFRQEDNFPNEIEFVVGGYDTIYLQGNNDRVDYCYFTGKSKNGSSAKNIFEYLKKKPVDLLIDNIKSKFSIMSKYSDQQFKREIDFRKFGVLISSSNQKKYKIRCIVKRIPTSNEEIPFSTIEL